MAKVEQTENVRIPDSIIKIWNNYSGEVVAEEAILRDANQPGFFAALLDDPDHKGMLTEFDHVQYQYEVQRFE